MQYYFNVSNLYLSCTNSRKQIVSDSVNFHTAKFTLDSDWQGYTIKAIFTNSKDNTLSVEQLLDINNECAIPSSPISIGGELIVKLVGETINSRIETTMINDLSIVLSSVGNGNEDIVFTPSIVQQLQAQLDIKFDDVTYENDVMTFYADGVVMKQITVSGGGGSYTLPTMSSTVKGGAKLGDNLEIVDDVLKLQDDISLNVVNLKDLQGLGLTYNVGDLWREDGHAYYKVDNDVTLDLGRELYINAMNQTGVTIPNGTLVYQVGSVGASGVVKIAPFLADGNTDWGLLLGMATEDILNGEIGNVTTYGAVNGINTNSLVEGEEVYASSTVYGGYTTTKPSYAIRFGVVIRKHTNTGIIFIKSPHYETVTPTATVEKVGSVATITLTDNNGTTTASISDGTNGDDGRGIVSVTKISTVGLVDTYEITYTDSTTSQFTISNGSNGTNGRGIAYISLVGTVGLVDQYRITFDDGTQTNYSVTNGKDGIDGLTTSVELNGTTYTQSGGKITLPNLEPSLPIAPIVDPQLKFLNANKEWVDVSLGSGGNSSPLYYTTNPSDIATYLQIDYTPQVTEIEASNSITNQELLFRTYLYSQPIGVTLIDAGVWSFTFTSKVNSASGITQFKAEPFLRHIDGSETILFSAYSDEINNTVYETKTKEITQPPFSCLATDRLGIRMYGKTTSNSAITVSVILGDGRGGYFETPLRLRHNQLRDLNGDPSYQHITQTWKDSVDNNIASLLPQGILDNTSVGTISKELVRNIPIKIATALTSLTLTYPTTYYWYDVFTIIFKTSALTLPSGVVWHDGTAPTIDSGKWYELSIRDNRAVLSGGVA